MSPQTGRFQPVDRLRRSVEFQQVIRQGRRVAGDAFVVVCAERRERAAAQQPVRLGITVSRKVGNAIVRNRVKRRIREWFRAGREPFGAGLDLVVIGRAAAAQLPFSHLCEQLSTLSRAAALAARRAGVA